MSYCKVSTDTEDVALKYIITVNQIMYNILKKQSSYNFNYLETS